MCHRFGDAVHTCYNTSISHGICDTAVLDIESGGILGAIGSYLSIGQLTNGTSE